MQETINLKNPFIRACQEFFPKYGISYSFLSEITENTLNSGSPVNLLVGLSKGINGNIVLGLTKESTLIMISKLTGRSEVSTIDFVGINALCEFANVLCGKAIAKVPTKKMVFLSSTTLAIGEKVFLIISKTSSQKLFFKIEETEFSISYNIE